MKGFVMTIDELNAKLQCLADEDREAKIDSEYEQFLEYMYAMFENEQYERDCYDLDADYYGELI